MSIKKLFDSTNKTRNYLSDADEKDTFGDVESARNVRALKTKQDTFVPHVDYSDPTKFAKYGSAYLYYKSAVEYIHDYYPYDGSDAEINEFYNKLLGVEKHVFNDLYPRTNGYVILSADGWGTTTMPAASEGYGLPSSLEYITFFGGPNTSSYTKLAEAFDNPTNSKTQFSNIYNTDIYTSEGLPSDYASGSRESNLRGNFDEGVTVEFWLKTGSLGTALTEKQVVFDMWNNVATSSADYGRITIELSRSVKHLGAPAGTTSPFVLTVQSGTTGIYTSSIGIGLSASSLSDWAHYAFVIQNSGSSLVSKLYVDGALNHRTASAATLDEINSKGMMGRIGALLSRPSGNIGNLGDLATCGKLSGSIDEFRFWKVARDSNQIARYYNDVVKGGSNTDISNTTLGLYYKFNEGITTTTSTDNTVLDYSGRISNGVWTGYGTNSRNTGSAIVSASAASTEYLDPIIHSNHPDVASLKSDLLDKGEFHDSNNNAAFVNLVPSWVLEEEEALTSDLRLLSHIVATYLDKLYLQISALPSFKRPSYTSASYSPIPFAEHLPQSLGLYTPELFIDSTVLEKFSNRNQDTLFENDLSETKNLIYLNLYNSLSGIYKAKGTEKAVKNILRCFYLDDRVVKFKTYADNQVFELKNNLELTLAKNTSINLNKKENIEGVVYQSKDSSNPNSVGFITGSYVNTKEPRYGFTAEANIIFPSYNKLDNCMDTFDRDFNSASLFGMYEVVDPDDSAGTTDTTWRSTDRANFQVFAVRDSKNSKNAYFVLTSSNSPEPFSFLTSSTFLDVYDNEQWNISVRLKPDDYPLGGIVTGSTTSNYIVEFRGVNAVGDTVQNSFYATASITTTLGRNFAKVAKRMYVGAHRTNVTGALLHNSDVLVAGLKYWTKYMDDGELNQHLYDINNQGISGSYRNISALDSNLIQTDALNLNTLALSWNFDNITGSDSSGNLYYVTDISSGSAGLRNNYGWIGEIAGYQHTGYGYGFAASSTDVVNKDRLNSLKFTDPEAPVSSEMIKVLTNDEVFFPDMQSRPRFFHIVEKSMYSAISEEILKFFAGVVDFNNIIGEPVNRYRERYKSLEKLREIFFRKVTYVSDVEKYIDYYRWLDDAIAEIISQMMPASSGFVKDAYNIVEGHVLERNKYKTKFPTLEFKAREPRDSAPMMGIEEKTYGAVQDEVESTQKGEDAATQKTNRQANQQKSPSGESRGRTRRFKTSGDDTVDRDLRSIGSNAASSNDQKQRFLTDAGGTVYETNPEAIRAFSKPYMIEIDRVENTSPGIVAGGVNFSKDKRIGFTYNALYPAGPVITSGGVFVPQNILLAFKEDLVPLKSASFTPYPNKKTKRIVKVQHGRDWEDGYGYANVKSTIAFPFNIISSSVDSGYNKHVIQNVSANIMITNLHNDVYGDNMERPMQGPFTEYAVGGHQSRHVKLNTGSDDYTNRPEAWKLLLGAFETATGAIGMVGADYPWPEANAIGVKPYPMTASQKAVFYRDHIAKRPVNIRNIQHTTGSTVLGNYSNRYEVIHSVGAFTNPRGFIDNQPSLPSQLTNTPSGTQGRSILDIRRDADSHFEFVPAYSINYLTASTNKTIIRGRFSSVGGMETMNPGYGDIRSGEYSVYNAINYRNLSTIRPNQNMSGAISENTGSGTPGIRVTDIHGRDFGLRTHLARHTGRFGRDPTWIAAPGATTNESASFNKIQRNTRRRIVQNADGTYSTSSQYDNFFVQHQIPRADRQYAWITGSLAEDALTTTSSLVGTGLRWWGYAPIYGPQAGYYSSSATGWTAYFDFVSASAILGIAGTAAIYQPALELNYYINDPADDNDDNILGYPATSGNADYYNTTLIGASKYGIVGNLNQKADFFNLLMTKRKNTFGYRGAPQTGPSAHPILRKHRKNNTFTCDLGTSQRYTVKPVTIRGQPASINMDVEGENVTLRSTYGNENLYFSDSELNERLFHNPPVKSTAFKQIVDIGNATTGYKLNWVAYSETLFPSKINEFTTGSSTRVGYNNLYWRDTRSARNTLHNDNIFTNSFGVYLTQSAWPLDEPTDFLTRAENEIPYIKLASNVILKISNSAGELQNEYFHIVSGTFSAAARRKLNLAASALYARKHVLPGAPSVVSPSGIPIAETGSYTTKFDVVVGLYTGEAVWEADSQAGIIKKDSGVATFQSHSSKPWFNDYDAFKYDLGKISKDFAIVPEFRISEHVEDYKKFGITADNKFDTFEVVGTGKDSSQSNFYKDYSNSDFMSEFLKVSEETLLGASEIMLVCSASIRLNPYKGFYPVQRTVDLVTRFKNSFINSIIGEDAAKQNPGSKGGTVRPLMQALYSPGLLYNTIKSGIAVDYPIVTEPTKLNRTFYGAAHKTSASAWMLTAETATGLPAGEGYDGGPYWDYRIPFETLIKPEKYLTDVRFFDTEPHPSASLNVTGAFKGKGDPIYSLMASNFFGEVGNFFLKDGGYTRLESDTVTSDLEFKSGSVYGARLSIRRSLSGSRTYVYESGSSGNNVAYGQYGGKAYNTTANTFMTGVFPLPQDPRQAPKNELQENFTMYSRPTAFGPAIAGRPSGALGSSSYVVLSNPADSVAGFNWAYTPPYYNGESWLDIIFEPTADTKYDLEKILSETKTIYWRADPGVSSSSGIHATTNLSGTQLLPTFSGNIRSLYGDEDDLVYDGKNINANAMQISASINCFGIERVARQRVDKFGNPILSENETVGKKWVIQPKMETPMLNFNNQGTHPISNADSTLSLPSYSSASVPRGMWHQFGIIDPDPSKGIFLEIGDIPTEWLKYHYDVITNNSAYNKNNASGLGANTYKTMKSLTDIVKFDINNTSKRLGELAENITIKEAIVAVPYSTEVSTGDSTLSNYRQQSKTFFSIDRKKIDACLDSAIGSETGDSTDFAGESIRKLVQKMQRYNLPPQFDFINNLAVDPMAMYIFEFEYTFDKDDLSYIWQNLAPRNYQKITKTFASVAHPLAANELLEAEDVLSKSTRWMVFKVKQRSQVSYEDQITSQAGESANKGEVFDTPTKKSSTYPIEFNWPYDYVSFVESIKFDTEVLYRGSTKQLNKGKLSAGNFNQQAKNGQSSLKTATTAAPTTATGRTTATTAAPTTTTGRGNRGGGRGGGRGNY